MNFSDIFKSSFLESVNEFSIIDTCIGMAFAIVLGLFIFMIYKKTFSGIMYSTGFAMSLVGLSMVTTLVIMAVTSHFIDVVTAGILVALALVAAAGCKLPFCLGGQAEGFACQLVQLDNECLAVVPGNTLHRAGKVASEPARVAAHHGQP